MKIGYKIRNISTDRNDWLIAVIYEIEKWPGRTLTHKGLNDYQFTREMTEIEKSDYMSTNYTRFFWVKYKSLDLFRKDEELCGVDPAFVEKVCSFYSAIPQINKSTNQQ